MTCAKNLHRLAKAEIQLIVLILDATIRDEQRPLNSTHIHDTCIGKPLCASNRHPHRARSKGGVG
jgi:hypothetical protein